MDGTVIETDYAETNHLTGHKKYWKMGVDEAGETFSVPLTDSKEILHICKTGGEAFPKPGGPINYDGDAPEFKKSEGRSMEKEYDDRGLTIIPESFASIDDFKECMEHGGEVCFGWKGVDYCCFGCISPSPSEKPKMVISQAGSAEVNLATEMWGDTADEILEYMVGEDRLRDVITQVEVFDRTV